MLERCIFPSLPRSSGTLPPDVTVCVVEEDAGFALLVNGERAAEAPTVRELETALIRAVDDAVIGRMPVLRAVHAGAVAWGDRALLLPGKTQAGKSSIVAELIRNGSARYFSDEYALLDPEGRVHPYPRPLMLRNGAPHQTPTPAAECGGITADAPAHVSWIVSLQYTRGEEWSIRPVMQGEGVITLLRNTPHVWAETPGLIGVFERAAAGAVCWEGRRGEAADAAREILRLTGNG